jgi:hypothetical protein
MNSSKNTVSKNSEISKVLKQAKFNNISSSASRKSRPLSPTRSTARSIRQKTPEPANINSSPVRESKSVKKPFAHKYIRVRSGTKTNEIPSWLENIFNKK